MIVSGARIREARLSSGMTQAQLARSIETREKNIVRWENDQNQPRVEHVAAIARATGRDLEFFLTSSAEADDEEDDRAVLDGYLDDYLRRRVRQILREEREARR